MISLETSATLPDVPVWLAGRRTEKSPARMAFRAVSRASSSDAWPFAPFAPGGGIRSGDAAVTASNDGCMSFPPQALRKSGFVGADLPCPRELAHKFLR